MSLWKPGTFLSREFLKTSVLKFSKGDSSPGSHPLAIFFLTRLAISYHEIPLAIFFLTTLAISYHETVSDFLLKK